MQNVFVSGANRGIGLEHVRRFAAAGAHVFAAVRNPADSHDLADLVAAGSVTLTPYDAADAQAPAAVAAAIGDRPLEIVFNNAGVYGGPAQTLADLDPDAFLETLRINTLAPLALTRALLPHLRRGARKLIANQSSRMGSIADNGSGGFYAYRAAKAGLNMVTKSLAQDLRSEGFTVIALHPGWVQTRMGGSSAPLTVTASVDGQAAILRRVTAADTGKFFDYSGEELPW